MIEWLPWLPSKSCYTNLKFFETLKDTPNPSKGFRFVAFLVLEILGGPFRPPPPWCLVWVPKPLVPGGLNQSFNNISSSPKTTLQICLVLHQFNLYVLPICIKKLVTIKYFLSCLFQALKMDHFRLFSKYGQKLPFCHTF